VSDGVASVVDDGGGPPVNGSAVAGEAVVALGEEGLVVVVTLGFVVDVPRVVVDVTVGPALEAFVDFD